MTTTTPLRFLVIAIASIAAALIFRDFLVERIYVASPSMEPTLAMDSRWWLDKLSLRLRGPNRQDVVVLKSPVSLEKDLIKRVIAVGGDTIEIRDKIVILNSAPLNEPYTQYTRSSEILQGDNLGPVTVPRGHVFLLGDNRDESGDSRDWRDLKTRERVLFIPAANLKGRLLGIPEKQHEE